MNVLVETEEGEKILQTIMDKKTLASTGKFYTEVDKDDPENPMLNYYEVIKIVKTSEYWLNDRMVFEHEKSDTAYHLTTVTVRFIEVVKDAQW